MSQDPPKPRLPIEIAVAMATAHSTAFIPLPRAGMFSTPQKTASLPSRKVSLTEGQRLMAFQRRMKKRKFA